MSYDLLDFNERFSPTGLLLSGAMDELSLDELLSVHRQSLADVRAGVEDSEIWLSIYSIQLTTHGRSGFQALWEAIEAADPHPMWIMLTGLLYDPGRRSQLRRHFHKLLGHDDPEYIVVGVEGFMMIEDRKARRRVLDLRNHESPEVRAAVLGYIREVCPNETLKAMVDAFDDPDATVRQTAVTLLLTHTVVEASEPVRQALRRQRRPRHVRDYARDVLEGVGNPSDDLATLIIEARDYLTDDLGGKIRWKDVERAQRAWGEDVPVDPLIAMAMEHPDDRRLRQRIEELWRNDDDWERYLAISMMTIRRDREHEAEILALRGHASEDLYSAAHMYHRMLDPKAAVPAMIDLLDNGTEDARLFAIATLNQIYVHEVDEHLRERLEALRDDPDETVRNLAAFALASEWERRFTKGLILTRPDEPDD